MDTIMTQFQLVLLAYYLVVSVFRHISVVSARGLISLLVQFPEFVTVMMDIIKIHL